MKKIACLICFLMVQGACFSAFGMDENGMDDKDFLASKPPSPRASASVDQEERGHNFTQFKESVEALNKKNLACVSYLKLQTAQMFVRISDRENQDLQDQDLQDIEIASHRELEKILGNLNLLQESIGTFLEMGAVDYQANSSALEQKLEEMRKTYFERILQVTEIQKGDILSILAAQKQTLIFQRKKLLDQDQKIRELEGELLRATQDILATERRTAAASEGVRPQVAAVTGGEAAAGSLALVVQHPALNVFEIFQQQPTPPVGQRFKFVGAGFLQTDITMPFHMDLLLVSHGMYRQDLIKFCSKLTTSLPYQLILEIKQDLSLSELILQILQNAKVASSSPFEQVFKERKEEKEEQCMKAIIDFYLEMFSQRVTFLNKLSSTHRPLSVETVFFTDDQTKKNRIIDEMVGMLSNLNDLLFDLNPEHLKFTAPLALRDHWLKLIGELSKEEKSISFSTSGKLAQLKTSVEKSSHESLTNILAPTDYIRSIITKLSERKTLDRGNLGKFFQVVSS